MSAKIRYDIKRKSCPERRAKERARSLARSKKREGWCQDCGEVRKTVLHHVTYEAHDSILKEVCHPCHRVYHPRKMPNGSVV